MKKNLILAFLCGIALSSLVAFTVVEFTPTKATANVEQVDGIYIFYKSAPVMAYDVIDTQKTTVAMSGKPAELLKIAMKKAKDTPGVEGIVFNEDMDRYTFIKFK